MSEENKASEPAPVQRNGAAAPVIRRALAADLEEVVDILQDAVRWLREQGMPMWKADDISGPQIGEDIGKGLFFIGESRGQLAFTFKYQLEDLPFWPDIPPGSSAFVHRLAVRRRFAGEGLSQAALAWAAERTRSLGLAFLRLDCEASRPRLRAMYERFGFRHHSDRQVGPLFVARYEFDVSRLRG